MPTLPEPFVKGQGNFAGRLNQLRSYVAALLTEEQSNAAYPPDRLVRAASRLDDVVVFDTFNRANAGSLGTSDSGHAWVDPSSAWGITDNEARATTTSLDHAWVDAGIGNGVMRCSLFRAASRDMRLTVRLQDASNFLQVRWIGHGSARELAIYKTVAGSSTLLVTQALASAEDDVRRAVLEVEVKAGVIIVRALGYTLKHTLSEGDLALFPDTLTRWGMRGPGGGTGTATDFRYNDFVVART